MTAEREGVAERWVAHIPSALRRACGHDSRSVEGCLNCEAADHIAALDAAIRALRQGGEPKPVLAWLITPGGRSPMDAPMVVLPDALKSRLDALPSGDYSCTPLGDISAPPSPAKEG